MVHPLWFDYLMKVISLPGNPPTMAIIVVITCVFLFIFNFRRESLVLASGMIIGQLFENFVKILVDRPRPTLGFNGPSFPNGHVLTYTLFFGFLAFLAYKHHHRIISICLLIPISLIGLSRIYLGAHWPSDVLASYIFGALGVLIMIKVYSGH